MNHNGTRSPEAIIAEIEQTRAEMNSTLHAIEERLTPGQLMDKGLDYLRNSGGREYLSNLGTSVKTNPMPAALMGVSLLWMMLAERGIGSGIGASRAYGAPYDPSQAHGKDLHDRAQDLRDRASGMRERAAETAGAASESVKSALHSAQDRMSSGAQRVQQAWSRTSETTRYQFDRARSSYRHVVQEQPLALAAVGLGIGALIAALAPRTRREDELMGRAADSVKHGLADSGREQMQRAESALKQAAQNMTQPASHTSSTGAAAQAGQATPATAAAGPADKPQG